MISRTLFGPGVDFSRSYRLHADAASGSTSNRQLAALTGFEYWGRGQVQRDFAKFLITKLEANDHPEADTQALRATISS
jgi:hypothetical protein